MAEQENRFQGEIINPDIIFRTSSHPEANGRIPQQGEFGYSINFTLEDGRILSVETGESGYKSFVELIKQMEADDAVEKLFKNSSMEDLL